MLLAQLFYELKMLTYVIFNKNQYGGDSDVTK